MHPAGGPALSQSIGPLWGTLLCGVLSAQLGLLGRRKGNRVGGRSKGSDQGRVMFKPSLCPKLSLIPRVGIQQLQLVWGLHRILGTLESSTHPPTRYFSSTTRVPGHILGLGETAVGRRDRISSLGELQSLVTIDLLSPFTPEIVTILRGTVRWRTEHRV